jgi:hypothetical protein
MDQADKRKSPSPLQIVSLTAMTICLAFEGFFLLFSGFPFSGLSMTLYATGVLWLLSVVATVFALKQPIFPVAAGLAMFSLQTVDLQNHVTTKAHSIGQFLYEHSIELIYLVSAISLLVLARPTLIQRRSRAS